MTSLKRLAVLADAAGTVRGGDIVALAAERFSPGGVVQHPLCPPEILEQVAAASNSTSVLASVLTHPSRSRSVRDALAQRDEVRRAAVPNSTVTWQGAVTSEDAAALVRAWEEDPVAAGEILMAYGPGDRGVLLGILVRDAVPERPALLHYLWECSPVTVFAEAQRAQGEGAAIAALATGTTDLMPLGQWLSDPRLHWPVRLHSTLGWHVRNEPEPWARLARQAGVTPETEGVWEVLANHPETDPSLLETWALSAQTPAWIARDACLNPALGEDRRRRVSEHIVARSVEGDLRLLTACGDVLTADDALNLTLGVICEDTWGTPCVPVAVRAARRAMADALAQAENRELARWALAAPASTSVRQVLDLFPPRYR